MKVLVKTLKGSKFEIQVTESMTVAEVKQVIEKEKAELPADSLKLIHSGKVLADADTVTTCGIQEQDFLVVMVTKVKTPAKAAAKSVVLAETSTVISATTATDSTTAAASVETAVSSTETNEAEAVQMDATVAAATATTESTTENSTTASSTSHATNNASPMELPSEAVEGLVAMGFPEPEVRHCLRAANGNPDIAVEFLTNGIPEGVAQVADVMNQRMDTTTSTATTSVSASSSAEPLQALRQHPQFNDLRRLVQSNPAMLQQVLTQIGQQQPALLTEINQNQALFLSMMNEPIPAAATAPTGGSSTAAPDAASAAPMGGDWMGNPMQMATLIQNMSPNELERMAAVMGIPAEQLRATAQMIGSLPPEQLEQFMMQAAAMEQEGGAADGGFPGGRGGGGRDGGTVLHLTPDEMAAVDRLTEMGFDRSEAAQAFLACDKNEALAANLLMDGGFGFGGDDDDDDAGFGGGGSNNDGSGGADDDDEDMYE